ncbi:hypothetical protein MYX78_01805 [Acidobacteria bacterium AH-259-G07]|nr:hypothetical protein [Acidobacteria bacterium AH-259-G07]
MGIKYSTGRGTKVKHSTGSEFVDLEKRRKKYFLIKHSTGKDAAIKHVTGVEFDLKRYEEMAKKEPEEA